MKVEIKRKYPCGYEVYTWMNTGIFDATRYEFSDKEGCPIHGHSCRAPGQEKKK